MAVPSRQIGWSTESNLLWQICNQIDRMTGVIGSTLSTFVPQSRTLTINGVTYDLSADRSWTVAAGISGSGATGQVAYWNGTSSQTGSNNLFWDAANARLGIGTATPASPYRLDVNGAIQTNNYLMSPAVYSNGAFQLGVLGGTVGFRLTTLLNTQLFGGATPADSGQRLQVIGDAFIKGSGATNATIGLQVQNSAGTDLFIINNSGYYKLSGSNGLFFSMFTTSQGAASISGTNTQFYNYTTTQAATFGAFSFHGDNFTQTSGSVHTLFVSKSFYPTSGTATHSSISIAPAINQTGGANGITRGLYVTPTIVAAADWRSIEWNNNTGWGLYGAGTAPNYLGGDLTVAGVFRETVTTNRQTASYTLALADNGKLVEMNVATANNLTIPLNSSIAFPIGTKIDLAQYGAGQTTVVATGGVTVRSAGGALKLALQYSGATLVKIATDEWYLFGDITT